MCLFPGEDRGPVLEVIVSRTNFISSHTSKSVRVVGLSTALANARDLADWLGIAQVRHPSWHQNIQQHSSWTVNTRTDWKNAQSVCSCSPPARCSLVRWGDHLHKLPRFRNSPIGFVYLELYRSDGSQKPQLLCSSVFFYGSFVACLFISDWMYMIPAIRINRYVWPGVDVVVYLRNRLQSVSGCHAFKFQSSGRTGWAALSASSREEHHNDTKMLYWNDLMDMFQYG